MKPQSDEPTAGRTKDSPWDNQLHFEIIGRDPAKLRSYYGDLFGWKFQTGDAVNEAISQPGNYGFVDENTAGEGINGGIGGGEGYEARVLFYVSVPNGPHLRVTRLSAALGRGSLVTSRSWLRYRDDVSLHHGAPDPDNP